MTIARIPRLPSFLLFLFCFCRQSPAQSRAPVSFKREIAPLFLQKCVSCHGPDKSKGGFQLHTFEFLKKGGKGEKPVLTPGQPDRSELSLLLKASDPDDRMPQKDDPLSPSQISLIDRWIAEGAHFDGDDPRLPIALLVAPPEAAPPSRYPQPVPILALAVNAAGDKIATGGYHEITVWSTSSGQLLERITNVAERVFDLEFGKTNDDLYAAAGSPGRSGELALYPAAGGKKILARSPDAILSIALSPDGLHLASGGCDNLTRIITLSDLAASLTLEHHADWVLRVRWNADGTWLLSTSRDRSLRIVSGTTGQLEASLVGLPDIQAAADFLPDGKQVVSGGRDRKLHFMDVQNQKKTNETTLAEAEITNLIVSGQRIFTGAANGLVREHDLKKHETVRTFPGQHDCVYALRLHGDRLFSGAYDGRICVWNTLTGDLILEFIAAPGYDSKRLTEAKP